MGTLRKLIDRVKNVFTSAPKPIATIWKQAPAPKLDKPVISKKSKPAMHSHNFGTFSPCMPFKYTRGG